MKYEVEKNLVVSTAHMTREDDERLLDVESNEDRVVVYQGRGWVMIHLPSLGEGSLEEYSSALREICAWAANHEEDFAFIKFDRDAEALEGFPTFDW